MAIFPDDAKPILDKHMLEYLAKRSCTPFTSIVAHFELHQTDWLEESIERLERAGRIRYDARRIGYCTVTRPSAIITPMATEPEYKLTLAEEAELAELSRTREERERKVKRAKDRVASLTEDVRMRLEELDSYAGYDPVAAAQAAEEAKHTAARLLEAVNELNAL